MPAVVRWLNPTTIPDPAPSGFLLVTEAGDYLVDELGNQLAYA